MLKYIARRFFLLLALYSTILFGIIVLQFKNSNTFTFSTGSLRASGSWDQEQETSLKPSLPLHITVNGLDFFIDTQNPVLAFGANKQGVALSLLKLEQFDKAIRLSFSEEVEIVFASEKRGEVDTTTISTTLPKKYQKIRLPYKIMRSTKLEKLDSQVLLSVGNTKYTFLGVAISEQSGLHERYLELSSAQPLARYQTWIPAKGININNLSSIAGARKDTYQTKLEEFAQNSLAAFKIALNSGSINEPLVTAYVAEMGRVGMYHAALDVVPESWRLGSNKTWLSNTFFNNLEKTWLGFMAKEREERTLLSKQISEKNPACFEFPSLVPYLLDRGSAILLSDLLKMSESLVIANLTPLQAAGIIEAGLDLAQLVPTTENNLATLYESCERILSASLLKFGDELFIGENKTSVDTKASLRIAKILIRYGDSNPSKSSWRSCGYLLVTSLLNFSGDRATLPANFAISGTESAGGVIAKTETILSPAVLYPLIMSENTWYPHIQSFAFQGLPGIWAWTSAQSITLSEPSKDVLKIATRFPQGETHYLVLRGIKPFSRIQIYGMDFRSDPRFENYNSSGYRYNQETETLFLKMRHKAEIEDVILYFANASTAQPKASTEEISNQTQAPVLEEASQRTLGDSLNLE